MVIEQAFGSLKNRWCILNAFNMYVKKATLVTLAFCVLHNYCEIHNQRVFIPADVRLRRDPHVGIDSMWEGCNFPMKVVWERMRNVLFSSWLERNPE
jgi:hypothetical protein